MFEDIIEIESGGILPTRWLREAVNDDVIYSKRLQDSRDQLSAR